MNLLHAALLGVVEGLTEFLPVSSTGHLILTAHLLGLDDGPHAATASFEIVIQLGALLAVAAHYRALLTDRAVGVVRRDAAALRLAAALAIGFVPLAVAGLSLRKVIKAHLFGPMPVAVALIVGGLVMMAWPRLRGAKAGAGLDGLEHVTPKRALIIGLGQCLALVPGTSRSMSTILAGEAAGLSTRTSAEFSFLLALPTLGAATVYEMLKARHELLAGGSAGALAVGLAVSFVVAWAVIAGFLRYLGRHGLAPFGVYRVVVGVTVFALLMPRG